MGLLATKYQMLTVHFKKLQHGLRMMSGNLKTLAQGSEHSDVPTFYLLLCVYAGWSAESSKTLNPQTLSFSPWF